MYLSVEVYKNMVFAFVVIVYSSLFVYQRRFGILPERNLVLVTLTCFVLLFFVLILRIMEGLL